MKKIFKRVIYSVVFTGLTFVSVNLFAGVGDESPNPTGGFGAEDGSYDAANPTGGFGDYYEDFDIMSPPPPPPPQEIPLDGGTLVLLFSCIGLGAATIIKQVRR